MTPGYEALIHGAGLLDLSARGRIRVTGEDRARLLHAMSTNHVQQMKPGEGIYAFFLNTQGHILADAYILCFDDHFLLDTEPGTRKTLLEHLDRYIIADDAALEDVTEQTFALGLEGPTSADVAGKAGLTAPNHHFWHVRWGDQNAAAISSTGLRGVRIYGAVAGREDTVASLEAEGALAASSEDAETVRIEHFRPRYGVDITDRMLPQETQSEHAMHFQKGCYLGQEIVERVRSRGHVNRVLMGFRGAGTDAPARGTKILVEGKESGEVTSAAAADGNFFGLAYMRLPQAQPGALAQVGDTAAELHKPIG